jgi:protein TonB
MNRECDKTHEALAAFLDGDHLGLQDAEVQAHLEHCEACQQLLGEIQKARQASESGVHMADMERDAAFAENTHPKLSALPPSILPGPDYWDDLPGRVMERINMGLQLDTNTSAGVAAFKSVVDIFPYGAPELKQVMRRYLGGSLLIAVFTHLLSISSYYVVKALAPEEPPSDRIVRIVKYADIGPPPSLSSAPPPPSIAVSVPVAQPSIGVPVPVPDAEITEEQTFASQQEMSQMAAPLASESMSGDALSIDAGDFVMEQEPGMDEFVAVEVSPVPIKKVDPVYPDLARKAGVEGKVFVKVLVDKDGKVRKAVIMAGPDIFHETTIAAAMQWVFKPAIQRDKPIAVWVALPFQFKLR